MAKPAIFSFLLALALGLSSLTNVNAAPTSTILNEFASQAFQQNLIKKADTKKAKRLAASACRNSAQSPSNYYPSVTTRAVIYHKTLAPKKSRLKVNNRKLRKLIRLAVDTVCPTTQVMLEVPTDGWQEIEQGEFTTRFTARVTEGALLPLGNAWELNGELRGYVTSGEWHESAFFKIEMLDADLQPVIENYASSSGIDPSRPMFDNPTLQNTSWIGGYSAGQEYDAIGSGSDATGLSTWANAKFARVLSLTNADSAMFVLTAKPSGWVRAQ